MSSSFNNVILEGRLTRDPEFIKTKNNRSLCKFAIANNRYYYRNETFEEEVSYFDIVVWGNVAERAAKHLRKGRRVIVNGRLKQDRFVDKEGRNRSKIEVNANEVKFLDRKEAGESAAASGRGYNQRRAYQVREDDVIPETQSVPF